MKKSSIDWLFNKLQNNGWLTVEEMEEAIQTAREMHRQEIEEAVDDWMVNGNRKGKDYYTETFKQNDNKS